MSLSLSTQRKWFVLKFGGTSVSSADNWARLTRVIEEHVESGRRVVVVCSAVSGVTSALDSLLAALGSGQDWKTKLDQVLARQFALAASLGLDGQLVLQRELERFKELIEEILRSGGPSAKQRAALMSLGELSSTRIAAAWLKKRGLSAKRVDARDLLQCETRASSPEDSQHYLSTYCDYAPLPGLQQRLSQLGCDVIVTQGFIARDRDGDTVLLGRGGSDTSASYLAAILEASGLEIWTDVPGVFTTNPNTCQDAHLLKSISSNEAAVLASMGAKVLHPRCLQPAQRYGIPIHIGWTKRPDVEGTVIQAEVENPRTGLKAVSSRSHLYMLSMKREARWQPVGFMAEVSRRFSDHNLSMDLISSSPGDIRVTVDGAAHPDADQKLDSLLEDLRSICQPELTPEVASLSFVGTSVSGHLRELHAALEHLTSHEVHFVSHSADDRHVSYVVPSAAEDALVRDLHSAVFQDWSDSMVFGPSWHDLQNAASLDGARPTRITTIQPTGASQRL
ncbi:MAG: aspartate kinase [Myxococcales bacterium]|nr:aspartate kinase [Myxococcales bacterium]